MTLWPRAAGNLPCHRQRADSRSGEEDGHDALAATGCWQLLWTWGSFAACISKDNIPSRQPQHLSHLPVVGTAQSWLGHARDQEQGFGRGFAGRSSSTDPAPLNHSVPTGSASICRYQCQTASPGLSKERPAVFQSCTGVWHGRGTPGGQTIQRACRGARGDRLPAEAACFLPALQQGAELLCKPATEVAAGISERGLCLQKCQTSPPEPPSSGREPAAAGSSPSPGSPRRHPGRARCTPLHPNPHSHPSACSQTHGGMHTQRCTHT